MTSSTKPFAARIRQRELLIGTLISLPSPEITELLVNCGYDWLFIDAEHGAFDPHDAQKLLQAAGACPCAVRVPAGDDVWIKKALDIGAAGIIVPQVNTAKEAAAIIRSAKYPPQGARGIGLSRAHGYGLEFDRYLAAANEETAVILQAETRQGLENIEEIVKVAGIDAILIGPNDLAASLGWIGQLEHPQVLEAIDHIASTCRDAGVALGFFGGTAAAVRPYIEKGFKLITVGVDTLFLLHAAQQTLAALRD